MKMVETLNAVTMDVVDADVDARSWCFRDCIDNFVRVASLFFTDVCFRSTRYLWAIGFCVEQEQELLSKVCQMFLYWKGVSFKIDV
jgi:hypothetical protein